jgi:hypothetical protein
MAAERMLPLQSALSIYPGYTMVLKLLGHSHAFEDELGTLIRYALC